jgi:ribosomal protein S18 acetylase RimI-like enzyme
VIPAEKITLRPVQESDEGFLLSVYASTRADELAVVPWGPEQKAAFVKMQFSAQARHYSAEHPGANHDIIYLDAAPVGRLYLDRNADAFHILDVTLLPQFRNVGIGTVLLRRIIDEAGKNTKPVTIYVETFNRALSLFGKLGFHTVAEEGFCRLLQWSSAT